MDFYKKINFENFKRNNIKQKFKHLLKYHNFSETSNNKATSINF